jgi:O-antigen/teichoic acid export membrane protein
MSFFAIASQLRNIVAIAPSLLTEGSYAVMADPRHEAEKTPHRVMALCSFASITVSLLLAAAGIVIAPWFLQLLYGGSYVPAGVTAAVALATAVVHMGNAPAAARLTIVSIRATAVINTVWAVFVAAAACLLLFHRGSAAQAMSIYFVAHILSSALVLLTLKRKDHIPAGMSALFLMGTTSMIALVILAFIRSTHPAMAISITLLMLLILTTTAVLLLTLGKRHRWIPSVAAIRSLGARLPIPGWRQRHV